MSTSAERQNRAWFALTDAGSCRLFSCRVTQQGGYHIDEHDTIVNGLPEPRPLRPMTSGRITHYLESNELRFAGEVIRCLQKKAKQNKIDRMVIFVAPRMHGVLQMVSLGTLNGRIEELKGDFERLNVGQLEDHPKVRELMRKSKET